MTEQVKLDLQATLQVLEDKRWCQMSNNGDDVVCLEEAVAIAIYGPGKAWAWKLDDNDRQNAVRRALFAQMDVSELPYGTNAAVFHHGEDAPQLWVWNDAPGRTARQVKDLVLKAIEVENV